METVTDFIFLGSKSLQTPDHCMTSAMKLKDAERVTTTELDSLFKSRDIPLLTKVHLVKVMVFPVVIYGCQS